MVDWEPGLSRKRQTGGRRRWDDKDVVILILALLLYGVRDVASLILLTTVYFLKILVEARISSH